MKRGWSIIIVSMLLLQGCKLYMRVATPAPEPAVSDESSYARPGQEAGGGGQESGAPPRGQSAALADEKGGRP